MSAVPTEPAPARTGPDEVDLALEHLLAVEAGDELPLTALPCPVWCEQPPGHPFDSVDMSTEATDDNVLRFHRRTLHAGDDLTVELCAAESLDPQRVRQYPLHVLLSAEICSLDAAGSRALGEHLLGAAAWLEETRAAAPGRGGDATRSPSASAGREASAPADEESLVAWVRRLASARVDRALVERPARMEPAEQYQLLVDAFVAGGIEPSPGELSALVAAAEPGGYAGTALTLAALVRRVAR